MENKLTLLNIYPVTSHTDHVGVGSTFVVVNGMKEDGINYIGQAIARGATKIVLQTGSNLSASLMELIKSKNIELNYVTDTRLALAALSAQAFDYPARSLRIVGITGTKGKSTTAFLTEHILRTAGYKTALLSTVKNKIGALEFPATLTTAQPDYLHMFLSLCKKEGVEYVVMEVAAQAVSLNRVFGIEFDVVLFTNFSLEHSEFYSSMDDYFNAKIALTKQLKKSGILLLNSDDEKVASCDYQAPIIKKYSLENKQADLFTLDSQETNGSLSATICSSNTEKNCKIYAPTLVGRFNLYNILAAYSIASVLSVRCSDIQKGFNTFTAVPGRLQKIELPNNSIAFIDYAHNPSSFEAVLSAVRPLTDNLIVLFGAGGDRDKSKRPLMGKIAAQYGDVLMITSDNPRFEDNQEIINQIVAGVPESHNNKINIEPDRKVAIEKAYNFSNKGSIIMLLGKGPDEYQIIKDKKIPFSEAAILRSL